MIFSCSLHGLVIQEELHLVARIIALSPPFILVQLIHYNMFCSVLISSSLPVLLT